MITSRDDIKLSFERPRYRTVGNEVTCELRYCIQVPETFNQGFGKFNNAEPEVVVGFDLGSCRTAVGKAKCNEEDVFDKKLGRDIAEARAEAKAYKHAAKLVSKYVKTVAARYHNMALNFEAKADFIQDHNKSYVHEISK